MKQLLKMLKADFWIIILDIIAVNLSNFLALMIRYTIDFKIRPVALDKYLPAFVQFAPFYTIACIIVFCVFKLYGGLWKFAGINDMNRIVIANIVTAVIHIIGTIIIFPMPKSYYALGAIIQLILIVLIRFFPRIYHIEKQKIMARNAPAMNVAVIGLGDIGQQVINQIKTNEALRPVCYIDSNVLNEGMQYDGIPVISGIEKLADIIHQYKIQIVFVADQQLSSKERHIIQETCTKQKIEIQDYTGYLSNVDDAASLSGVLSAIKGPVIMSLYGEETVYSNGNQALKDIDGSYSIESISCKDEKIVIEIRSNQQIVFVLGKDKTEAYVGYDKWEQKNRGKEAYEG